MRERKERKNNIERLKVKKKQAKIKMLEFKKQKNRKNYSDSNLTKLNVKQNNNFNFPKKDINNEPLIRKKQKQAVENDTSIDEKKMLELEQALQDYINGSYITQYLAETAGKMPDVASVIKISEKNLFKEQNIYNSQIFIIQQMNYIKML